MRKVGEYEIRGRGVNRGRKEEKDCPKEGIIAVLFPKPKNKTQT